MDEGGAQGALPLAAELLATDIFWDREVVALGAYPLVNPPGSNEYHTHGYTDSPG